MASAYIIFDNSQRAVRLEDLLNFLREECGLAASLAEWRFFDQVVPQVHVETRPPIALQINEDPDDVPQEISELLDFAGDSLDERSRAAARSCGSRVEILACQPTQVTQFPQGGMLLRTPEADVSAPEVQSVLRQLSKFLGGWCFDNVNGGWIGVS